MLMKFHVSKMYMYRNENEAEPKIGKIRKNIIREVSIPLKLISRIGPSLHVTSIKIKKSFWK